MVVGQIVIERDSWAMREFIVRISQTVRCSVFHAHPLSMNLARHCIYLNALVGTQLSLVVYSRSIAKLV